MTKQKYVIVDVHPSDAFYSSLTKLAGTVVILGSDVEDHHALQGYISGKMYPINPERVRDLTDGLDYFYFAAVQLQKLEDALLENGHVYQVGH